MSGFMSKLRGVGEAVGGVGGLGTLGAVDTGLFLADEVGGPLIDALTTDALREDIGTANRARQAQMLNMLRTRREQMAKQENLVRLAQLHPEVYNAVASGRRLPRGATVLGGRPDYEALDRMATAMSQGTL